jgi:hypothetical protein
VSRVEHILRPLLIDRYSEVEPVCKITKIVLAVIILSGFLCFSTCSLKQVGGLSRTVSIMVAGLFFVVGLGMLGATIYYTQKKIRCLQEKEKLKSEVQTKGVQTEVEDSGQQLQQEELNLMRTKVVEAEDRMKDLEGQVRVLVEQLHKQDSLVEELEESKNLQQCVRAGYEALIKEYTAFVEKQELLLESNLRLKQEKEELQKAMLAFDSCVIIQDDTQLEVLRAENHELKEEKEQLVAQANELRFLYNAVSERHEILAREQEHLTQSISRLRQEIEELRRSVGDSYIVIQDDIRLKALEKENLQLKRVENELQGTLARAETQNQIMKGLLMILSEVGLVRFF